MFAFLPLATIAHQGDLTLVYERSGFLDTGSYAEAVWFCRRLSDLAPKRAKLISFGTSPEGRDMVALVVSKDGEFEPEQLSKSSRPLVYIENGIHSGEIEGKDATLILLRDILVGKKHEALLDAANLLVVPVFGLDAHERSSKYNRINQNGPREQGWRASGQNLNLNRDFIKADGGEMRAMIGLMHRFRPDFCFDNHTTDGANYPYQLHLGIPHWHTLDAGVAAWAAEMERAVTAQLEVDKLPNAPYFEFVGGSGAPEKGFAVDDFGPRYSTGYWAAMNRPSMLVETHMLKPYKERVDATYVTMVRTIEYVGAHAKELKAANAAADAAEASAAPGFKVTLTSHRTDAKRPFVFRGYEYKPYKSEVSGSMIPGWSDKPVEVKTTLLDTFEPGLTIAAPDAYAVPAPWVEAIDRLRLHGFKFSVLKTAMTDEFDAYRLDEVKFPTEPFESRFMPTYKAVAIRERRTLPPGTAIVPAAQVGLKLLMQMLEPAAPDSLAAWGFFNVVFERKEYFEDYAMEPIAAKMLASDSALKKEFEERLRDPAFAKNPRARLGFFYDRSPWADDHLNKYPVVRLDAKQLQVALGG